MTDHPDNVSRIGDAAAQWLARHDRGLSAEEKREFDRWLAADARHEAEWRSLNASWQAMDSLGSIADLAAEAARLERDTRRWVWLRKAIPLSFAIAAALALGVFLFNRPGATSTGSAIVHVPADLRRQTLPDGSVVEARGDSIITFDFKGPLRRVGLAKGEAFFTVAHDAEHPFVVEVDGGAAVRAVGTAFVVRHDAGGVDVLVTEGRVRVDTPTAAPLIGAGSTARIERGSGAPVVETRTLEPGELERALAWRSPMLEFSRATLDEVLAAFQPQSGRRVRLGDTALARRTISGTFQADNIEGFLRLADNFGLRVERTPEGDIILWPTAN